MRLAVQLEAARENESKREMIQQEPRKDAL
jgi:hypothetical protein